MGTMREIIKDAHVAHMAIGHFNFSDSTQLRAIVETAHELSLPVFVGLSEGEKNFIGIENAVALVRSYQARGYAVYLNLDHGHSVEACKEAIDAGFDSVMFDGSRLSFEENVAQTSEVVAYARASGRDVLIEGELGYIGSSSKILEAIPEDVERAETTVKQAQEFVERTGVDILAPSVGNLHGMLKEGNPALTIARIEAIRLALPGDVTLVLHGGSGTSDSDFKQAVDAGMGIVHINTEIRKAYKQGIADAITQDPNEVAPYKYLGPGADAMRAVVRNRVLLFAS